MHSTRLVFLTFLCTVPLTISLTFAEAIEFARAIPMDDGHVQSVSVSPDGKLVAGCGDQYVTIFRTADGSRVHRLAGHAGEIKRLTFSPNGKLVASCGRDQSVRIWNVETGEIVQVLKGHTQLVICAAFSPDSKTIASCSSRGDETIRVWDVESGRMLSRTRFYAIYLAWSPDGKCLAGSGHDSNIDVYRVTSDGLQLHHEFRHDGREMVSAMAFSPDSAMLATSGWDNTLRIWNVDKGNERLRIHGPRYARCIEDARWSPDSKQIISVTRDETLQRWDVNTGQLLTYVRGQNEGVRGLSISGDGQVLASGGHDDQIKLWRIRFDEGAAPEPRDVKTPGKASPSARVTRSEGRSKWTVKELARSSSAVVVIREFDRNGDGLLDVHEVLETPGASAAVKAWFAADTNRDGKLSHRELGADWDRLRAVQPE